MDPRRREMRRATLVVVALLVLGDARTRPAPGISRSRRSEADALAGLETEWRGGVSRSSAPRRRAARSESPSSNAAAASSASDRPAADAAIHAGDELAGVDGTALADGAAFDLFVDTLPADGTARIAIGARGRNGARRRAMRKPGRLARVAPDRPRRRARRTLSRLHHRNARARPPRRSARRSREAGVRMCAGRARRPAVSAGTGDLGDVLRHLPPARGAGPPFGGLPRIRARARRARRGAASSIRPQRVRRAPRGTARRPMTRRTACGLPDAQQAPCAEPG